MQSLEERPQFVKLEQKLSAVKLHKLRPETEDLRGECSRAGNLCLKNG